MAEESDLEKTEPGSAKRIEKAREQGQVARSRELSTFVLLATGIFGLWLNAGPMSAHLKHVLSQSLQFERAAAFNPVTMMELAGKVAFEGLQAVLPLLGMMVLAALAAPLMLGGWLFTTESLLPHFSKLNPAAGIGRMFSTQTLAELIKAIAKSSLVGGVAYLVISRNVQSILALLSEPVRIALPHMASLVANCCTMIILSLLIVVALDVPYQLWSHYRKLRMSKEDLRQEHKESDGDPHIKAKIRKQQQAMAKRRMMAKVATADVVLTNPTHFAVALKYDDKKMRAPRVVAKGSDLVALRIRALGEQHNVPILEAPPLTRALFRHTNLGDEIPTALYTAVAEVLAWVFQLKQWHKEGGIAPRAPSDLPVSESLDPLEGRA